MAQEERHRELAKVTQEEVRLEGKTHLRNETSVSLPVPSGGATVSSPGGAPTASTRHHWGREGRVISFSPRGQGWEGTAFISHLTLHLQLLSH